MADLNLFGFRIGKDSKQEEKRDERIPSPITPSDQDAPQTLGGGAFGAFGASTLDMDNAAKNEIQLITKYREMAQQPEAERAIDDIVNESIVIEDNQKPVSIVLDDVDQSEAIKKKIREEFDSILKMLDFNNQGYDLFRKWYIDGRMYFHKMIDIKNPRKGIQEIRYIDPRKIKKVREQINSKRDRLNTQSSINTPDLNKQFREYFLYNERGVSSPNEGIKIAKDSVTFVHSGITNENNTMILSHLHKALKPWNQLRWMEDSLVIYRISRAPERRVFYIDVGNLPRQKAEQYLKDMMTKHKNKLTYDANTGEVRDERRFMTMLEDFWLPRREGGRGTEIDTLPGGENLGQIEDVEFFQKKFYRALNIPISRLDETQGFNIGRGSEITRDELKFSKFISRLRSRFSQLFDDLLRTQLLLKGITDEKGWNVIKENVYYDFNKDNFFAELKQQEIMRERLNLLNEVDNYVGRYYSINWVRKNVLQQTDEEIKEIDKEIEEEGKEAEDEGDEAKDDNFGAFSGRADADSEEGGEQEQEPQQPQNATAPDPQNQEPKVNTASKQEPKANTASDKSEE